jgi:hypothetical protein
MIRVITMPSNAGVDGRNVTTKYYICDTEAELAAVEAVDAGDLATTLNTSRFWVRTPAAWKAVALLPIKLV